MKYLPDLEVTKEELENALEKVGEVTEVAEFVFEKENYFE